MSNVTMKKQTTAVLVGATGGIGWAMAEQMYKHGYNLVLVARSEQKLNALAVHLKAMYPKGGHLYERCCDISDAASQQQLIHYVKTLPQPVNRLINNAGISDFSLFEQQSPEKMAQLLSINAIHPLQLSQHFLRYFSERGEPAEVINVGSTFGSIAYPGFTAYCASKFALRGATEALSREYADTAIKVRYFAPRATQTPLNSEKVVNLNHALGNAMDTPELVAKEFVRFLDGRQTMLHLGWPEKFFVFVNKLLPNLVSGELKKALPLIRRYATQDG